MMKLLVADLLTRCLFKMWDERLSQIKEQYQALNLVKLTRIFPQIEANIDKLGDIQGHRYTDKKLASVALLHRSALVYWPIDKTGIYSNERLEFLGDSFLNFFIASESMLVHPELQEGELSRLRAAIVGTENLAKKSKNCGIWECLLVGKAELSVSENKRQNVLADAFEAVTAALLIDAGEKKARAWLASIFDKDLQAEHADLLCFDAKGKVQQWTQSIVAAPPSYRVIGTEGTPQQTYFIVAAFMGDEEIARATAVNKRTASKKVAEKIYKLIVSGELTKEKVLKYFRKTND